jgi:hypothetical protein
LRAGGRARDGESRQNPDIPPNLRTRILEHCVGESPYTDFNAGRSPLSEANTASEVWAWHTFRHTRKKGVRSVSGSDA